MTYGPIFTPLISAAPLNPLGPGRADSAALATLKTLSLSDAFAPHKITGREMADACRAGLFLLYDCFDESHKISQEIDTPTGSYWHGILHRREPDYGNAKYWFHRVGVHPIFAPLAVAARESAAAHKLDRAATFLAEQESWDPFRFIDLCEAASRRQSTSELLCRQIQRRECELLFDYCYRRARGEE